MAKQTEIYSCFPGTGKSHLYQMTKGTDLVVLDSDSSTFDKADFPRNYIEHIKSSIGKADVILVSSHQEVRRALFDEGIRYRLVIPHINCGPEYKRRYEDRGSSSEFIKLLGFKWREWITECFNDEGAHEVIVLDSNQYLTDVVNLAHHL